MKSGIQVELMSFGYSHGLPENSTFIFDLRALPNPFYDSQLRHQTGLDCAVSDYLFEKEDAQLYYASLLNFLLQIVQIYEKKERPLNIAVGCTGGQHRSVAFANKLLEDLSKQFPHNHFSIKHRDMLHNVALVDKRFR